MADHKDLLASLRMNHAKLRTTPIKAPTQMAGTRIAATDFTTLPGYRAVMLARAAADTLRLPSPFFREIEAVDGTRVRIAGNWAVNFASYDYLSFNRTPEIAAEVTQAVNAYGVSATASRLVGGNHGLHMVLEEELSRFLGTEDTLVFVSGHATNQAALRTLLGPKDLVAVDALAHNSIFEGIRTSGAQHITFAHNDWQALDRRLDELRGNYDRVLIVIEGLYSMDGDAPDLSAFVALKYKHHTWLMVDEAHSIGVLGKTGRGISEAAGIDIGEIDLVMGTLSKSLCSAGGFIAGSRVVTDLLRYHAPGFVYSVGLSIPNTAAALTALRAMRKAPERVAALNGLGTYFVKKAQGLELDCGNAMGTAIVPIIIGDSLRAVWISAQLLDAGYNVLPIIAPAVPERSARLRFFLNADHTQSQIDDVLQCTAELVAQARSLTFS